MLRTYMQLDWGWSERGLSNSSQASELAILNWIVVTNTFIVAICGNCLTIVALLTNRQLRRLSNAAIGSLAVADMLVVGVDFFTNGPMQYFYNWQSVMRSTSREVQLFVHGLQVAFSMAYWHPACTYG